MSGKRLISLIMTFILLIVICGCSNDKNAPQESTAPAESVTEEYISSTKAETDTSTTESTTESTTKRQVVPSTKPVKPAESTTNDLPPYVYKIKVLTPPHITTYHVGDEFTADGLKVQAYFHNGTTADVTDAVSFANNLDAVMSTPGVKRINVEYVDFDTNLVTTYFTITVKESLTEPTETTEMVENPENTETTEPTEVTEPTEITETTNEDVSSTIDP